MYLIHCKRLKRDHLLHKAILLSPSGTHFHANWVIYSGGMAATYLAPYFTSNIHIPECMMLLMTKLLNDLKNMPAAGDLCTHIASQLFGGPSFGKQTVLMKSAKIFKSTIQFGWSNMLAAHMLRVYQ
jgi:hypothetical protein